MLGLDDCYGCSWNLVMRLLHGVQDAKAFTDYAASREFLFHLMWHKHHLYGGLLLKLEPLRNCLLGQRQCSLN